MVTDDGKPRSMADVQSMRASLYQEAATEITDRLLSRLSDLERVAIEEEAARDCDRFEVPYDPVYAVEILLDRAGYTLTPTMPPFSGGN